MTCVGVLESGNLASIFAVTGHGFSLVPSLMYIFRGLLFLSNRNLSVLPPTFNTLNSSLEMKFRPGDGGRKAMLSPGSPSSSSL